MFFKGKPIVFIYSFYFDEKSILLFIDIGIRKCTLLSLSHKEFLLLKIDFICCGYKEF